MVDTCRKHVECCICKKKLCNENRQEAHSLQYHPSLMNEGLLPNGILPPADFPHPEPSRFHWSRCTWMAIDKLSINDILIENVPSAPPPQDTPNEEPIDPPQPDLTCTPDPTKTKAQRQVVAVQNTGGKMYGKAIRLYNKYRKYSEQWNPWPSFRAAHDFEQAESFIQETETWIDQHLRRGLDNIKIESFQTANAMQKLHSKLDFGLGDDSWIDDDSPLFGTLYYSDIFKCIQLLLAHLPFQAHLDFEPVRLPDWEGHRIYSKRNTGDWWWETHD